MRPEALASSRSAVWPSPVMPALLTRMFSVPVWDAAAVMLAASVTSRTSSRARALAEQARSASSNPVVYAELPGAQHSFDLLSSIRFEAVIDGIQAFTAAIAAPTVNRADRANQLAPPTR